MTNIYKLLFVYLVIFSHSLCAADSPEDFCENYFNTLGEKGLIAAPKFIHPDELNRFKSMFIRMLEPNGVALNHKELVHHFFGNDATYEKIKSASPENLMSMLMVKAMSHTKGFTSSFKVLGSIEEKESNFTHVVVRLNIINGNIQDHQNELLEILSLRRNGADWKLIPSSQFEIMIKQEINDLAKRQV
jgi:hypothetical protein